MARKPAKYNKDKVVKDLARKRIGTPPPARELAEKLERPKVKHKKKWPDDLES